MLNSFLKVANHIDDLEYMQVSQKSIKLVCLILPFIEQISYLVLTASREDICTLSQAIPSFMLLFNLIGKQTRFIENKKIALMQDALRKKVFHKKKRLKALFTVPPKIRSSDTVDQYEKFLTKFKTVTHDENIPFTELPSPFLLGRTADIERKKGVNSEQVKITLYKDFDIQYLSDCESADEDDPNNYEVDKPLVRNIYLKIMIVNFKMKLKKTVKKEYTTMINL
jgi:hypothetical protein